MIQHHVHWATDRCINAQVMGHGDAFTVPKGVWSMEYWAVDVEDDDPHQKVRMYRMMDIRPGEVYRFYEFGILKEEQ